MGTPEVYERFRPLMFAIAYRMLGTVSEAEDIVQEAFLRYHRTQSKGQAVESPRAFLSAVTTRLCIDHLRSAKVRRETYVGEWLPEPLLTDPAAPDPASTAEQADSLSMAFLLLLERLSPPERAVLLLHDVFGFGYPSPLRDDNVAKAAILMPGRGLVNGKLRTIWGLPGLTVAAAPPTPWR